MTARTTVILLLAAGFAGCATASAPDRVAHVRTLEAESAARLTAEGELLFAADRVKLSGYDYCTSAMRLLERGELRLGVREASKALFLGQQTGHQYLLANAKRDLAYAYLFAGYPDRTAQFADEALLRRLLLRAGGAARAGGNRRRPHRRHHRRARHPGRGAGAPTPGARRLNPAVPLTMWASGT